MIVGLTTRQRYNLLCFDFGIFLHYLIKKQCHDFLAVINKSYVFYCKETHSLFRIIQEKFTKVKGPPGENRQLLNDSLTNVVLLVLLIVCCGRTQYCKHCLVGENIEISHFLIKINGFRQTAVTRSNTFSTSSSFVFN